MASFKARKLHLKKTSLRIIGSAELENVRSGCAVVDSETSDGEPCNVDVLPVFPGGLANNRLNG